MASTINLVRNVLTSQYLTHNGSSVAVHFKKNHQSKLNLDSFYYSQDNVISVHKLIPLIVFPQATSICIGPLRRLQVFSDSNKKFTHVPAGGCTQTLTTNTTGSMIHVISSDAGSAVKLFVQDSGNKFYLRVNIAQNNNVQLVCQSYVDSVSSL